MSPIAARTVLIVEPDADARSALRSTFEREGYTVVATGGAADALSVLDTPEINLVVTELYLEHGDDPCLLPAIRGATPRKRPRVLAYTQHSRAKDREWAIAEGADGYVLKKNGEARLLEVAGRLSRRKPRTKASRRKKSS
jgi:two-component system, chemotaxis family, sensor kinase CheA